MSSDTATKPHRNRQDRKLSGGADLCIIPLAPCMEPGNPGRQAQAGLESQLHNDIGKLT